MKKFTSVVLFGRRNINSETEEKLLENGEARSKRLEQAFKQYRSETRTIFAVSSDDLQLVQEILLNPEVRVVELKTKTKGALVSLAMCLSEIDSDEALIVATGDAISKVNINEFLAKMIREDVDAGMVVMKSKNPNYSYIRLLDESVIEVVEKRIIGKLATTGVYFFKEKNLLVKSIEWVISNNLATNSNFYISTAMNYLISTHARIGIHEIMESDYER